MLEALVCALAFVRSASASRLAASCASVSSAAERLVVCGDGERHAGDETEVSGARWGLRRVLGARRLVRPETSRRETSERGAYPHDLNGTNHRCVPRVRAETGEPPLRGSRGAFPDSEDGASPRSDRLRRADLTPRASSAPGHGDDCPGAGTAELFQMSHDNNGSNCRRWLGGAETSRWRRGRSLS